MAYELTECGADVNTPDKYGKTPLFYAVEKENENMVYKLIECGADVNTQDTDGKTPLFYAVNNENEKMVDKLIQCGADVNTQDTDGKTPLFYAVNNENEKMVDKLIQCGADVNTQDTDGKTPLFYAVNNENEKMVDKVIQCGADVNTQDKDGATPLFYAVNNENEKMVDKLIECGADVNTQDKDGATPLFYAVNNENENMVDKLIECGADMKGALFYSIYTQSLSQTSYLFEKYLYLTKKSCKILIFFIGEYFDSSLQKSSIFESGISFLHEIKLISKDKETTSDVILNVVFSKVLYFKPNSRDVDLQALSELLKVALKYTAKFKLKKKDYLGQLIERISMNINKGNNDRRWIESEITNDILIRLHKLGVDPNTKDSDGNTALHYATQLALYDVPEDIVVGIFATLKDFGISYDIPNDKQQTPLVLCLSKSIEKVSRENKPCLGLKTQTIVCQFLVQQGSNLQVNSRSGKCILHLTFELLQHGFSQQNEWGETVFEEAMKLLQTFLAVYTKNKFYVSTQDEQGNTLVHLWAKLESKDYHNVAGKRLERIFQLFLENKANLDTKNKNGETPLHLCRTWTAAELLLDAGANPNDVDLSGSSPLLLAAKNNEAVKKLGLLYPDIVLDGDKFWKVVVTKDFDLWTGDRQGETIFSVLLKAASSDLAITLVDAPCDQDSPVRPPLLVMFSLLKAICKDKSANACWKKDIAEKILNSTKCPINGNDNEDSPLHYCCRNIIEAAKDVPIEDPKTTIHWNLAQLLRSYGADYRIRDETGLTCLDISEEYPALKDLLMKPIDIDRIPVVIEKWKSVSHVHKRRLGEVARHLECEEVGELYCYHKDYLAKSSFGIVFVGINEKDGREVAIKRIEKTRVQLKKRERETTNLINLEDCEQVVRYLYFFEDETFSYCVLELMDGNLDEFLNGTLQLKTKVNLCQDVVEGLKYLHEHNILHRDLKPKNILYKTHPELCLKIADFGLSRLIDSTSSSTVYGTNAGTRCWIAPEILKSSKDHTKSSDVFACGLVLHYILSVKRHPFAFKVGTLKYETETNIVMGNLEGWDNSLSPEAVQLIKAMLDKDHHKRPPAVEALRHVFFWSEKKKIDLLKAVGNQPEFECPRARRTPPLTAVETDLETRFGIIVKYGHWNDPRYVHMPAIYTEMDKRRRYRTDSVVELVRFIRNAFEHVSDKTRPQPIRKLILEDFVFLEYFPNLTIEVYKAVTTHGWSQTREEVKYALQ